MAWSVPTSYATRTRIDSDAKPSKTLDRCDKRLHWAVNNRSNRHDQSGVRFKRAPVAPTIFQEGPFGKKTVRLLLDSQALPLQMTDGYGSTLT